MNDSATTLHAAALPFSAPEPHKRRPPEWDVTAGDALRVLRTLEPASVDAVITDPPYCELINDHETVKPVELMRWLVRLTAPRDGVVLDPFAGSGSTGVACLLEGRSFRGIEQDPKYAAIARARIHAASSIEPRRPRSTYPTRKESGSTRCRATTHPTAPS